MGRDLKTVQNLIYEIRGQKVMLDRDLADLYGVELRVLNQAVKRNIERFPDDFMFQLTAEEWKNQRSQFVIFDKDIRKYRPFVFTEHGIKNDKRVNEIIIALNNLIAQPPRTKKIGFNVNEKPPGYLTK